VAKIVVVGAGLAGMSAAYELRDRLGPAHLVSVVGRGPQFAFNPSNPWVSVGWRKRDEITLDAGHYLGKRAIDFHPEPVDQIDAAANCVRLTDGKILQYDYLLVCTGPKLDFAAVKGAGPEGGHSHSICTVDHAATTWQAYQEFLKAPGPVVIGAVQGASCFGPVYEFAFILDADLRKRKLRDKVPMTLVTSEPYVGHLGLGGVGDSKGLMESELRQRHIAWVTNARVLEVQPDLVLVEQVDDNGAPLKQHRLATAFTMLLPSFAGVDAVAKVEGLTNPRGFVIIDKHQRSPRHHNIFAAGVCVAIAPPEATPVPTGVPKTGFMIESMVTTAVRNIEADLAGKPAIAEGTWNAVCLADMGDTGAAFIALPQIPPRNVTWAKVGKWVHAAKIAFEKYFLYKMRYGTSEPVYEKYVLHALGIDRLKQEEKGNES
jgi:sulfide:quinone oxidoreductase